MGVQKPLGKVHRQVKVSSLSRNQFRLLEGICRHQRKKYLSTKENWNSKLGRSL